MTLLSVVVPAAIVLGVALYVWWGRRLVESATEEKRDAMRRLLGCNVTLGVQQGRDFISEERGVLRQVRPDGVVLRQLDGDQFVPWSSLIDLREP